VDYDWITNRVATGAALSSAEDVQVLVDAGVTAVVDARAVERAGPMLVHIIVVAVGML
jgi:hypothetical protein